MTMTSDSQLSYAAGATMPPIQDIAIGDALRAAAADAADVLALVEGLPAGQPRRAWTYADLLADAEAMARALLSRANLGDRVAIWATTFRNGSPPR